MSPLTQHPSGMPLAGMHLILAERARQVIEHGYTPDHDDEHGDAVLAVAAACYLDWAIAQVEDGDCDNPPAGWPWDDEHFPGRTGLRGAVESLTRAGALIAAELDRLLRTPEATAMGLRS